MKKFLLPLSVATLLFACGQAATDEHSHGDGDAHSHDAPAGESAPDTAATHTHDGGHTHDDGHTH